MVRKERQVPNIWDAFSDFEWPDNWPSFLNIAAYRSEGMTSAIDVRETESGYLALAELPGIKKKDIHVILQNGVLTISAASKDQYKEEKDGRIICQERR